MKHSTRTLAVAFILASLGLTQLSCSSTRAQDPTPSKDPSQFTETAKMELIQTVPEETDLAVPGIKQAAATWLELVQTAQTSIDLEQMYTSNPADRSGPLEPILQALEAAAARGVKIRLMLSKAMQDTDLVTLARFRAMPGAEVRIIDYGALLGGIQHAKFWIVDSKTIFVGSQNLDYLSISQIHELGIKITHTETARRLQMVFDYDWKLAQTGEKPNEAAVPSLEAIAPDFDLMASPVGWNPAGIRDSISTLTGMLRGAKKSISIQTMIYSPVEYFDGYWAELDNAIRDAAARGVKVQLLVSHWNTDKPDIFHLKSLSLIPNVTLKISTIPLLADGSYAPYSRVIHSKYAIADGEKLFLGTANWSHGYFYTNRNVDFLITRPELITQTQAIFDKLWNATYSVPVDLNLDYPKPRKGALNPLPSHGG